MRENIMAVRRKPLMVLPGMYGFPVGSDIQQEISFNAFPPPGSITLFLA